LGGGELIKGRLHIAVGIAPWQITIAGQQSSSFSREKRRFQRKSEPPLFSSTIDLFGFEPPSLSDH
jgi:hypothetical protein